MTEKASSEVPCCASSDKPTEVAIVVTEDSAKADDETQASGCCGCWLQPHGPSGHSYLTKIKLASSLFSLFHVFTVVGFAKDIFVEKFGCDVTTMGTLFMVISFWTPLNQFIHGNLQDREFLARWFPIEKWGRRSPWFLTHLVIAAVAAGAMYLPPGQSQGTLAVWFFIMVFLANWGASSSLMAFETARVEIYPFKEERILVEGMCKYSCMLGGGSGGLPMVLLLLNATFTYRLGFAFYIVPMCLLSLWAMPVLKQAKHKSDLQSLGGVLSIFTEALPWRRNANKSMLHLLAVKWWHGAYGASVATALLYYITYVLQLSGWTRNLVIVGAGGASGLTEVCLNCFYMWYFGTGDSRSDKTGKSDRTLLVFVVIMRVVNAFITCIIIGFAPPSIPLLFVWAVASRFGLCGFSFWRISAQCWLVDEDCQFGAEPGRRREGILFGALNTVQNFAGAFFSSAVFIGLGIAGLQTKNCTAACGGSESSADCVENCFTSVIMSQPDSLRLFVRLVIGFWAPFCELMVAYHAWHFPLKGARLRKLYNSIRLSRGEDIASDDKIAVVAAGGRDRVEQIASHHAASKAGVHLGHPKNNDTEKLCHAIAFAHTRPPPKSMAVFYSFDGSERPSESAEPESEPGSPLPDTIPERGVKKEEIICL